MKSIMSVALAAVVILSVMTGCGRNKDKDELTPAITATPGQSVTQDRPDTAPGGDMEDAGDRLENGVNDIVGGTEDAVDDVVDATKDTLDDILGDDGAVNGDFNDGDVRDPQAKDETPATPEAR